MKSFFGVFFSAHPDRLPDVPGLQIGRHLINGEGVARVGSLAALAIGQMRNASQLRRALRCAKATTFSDLLLLAYQKWGEDCVHHIEGPCALIVLDQQAERLLLARDRMGEIPFFYMYRDGEVCFASHPEALLRLGARPRVDAAGLCEVFGLGPARTPGITPYADIQSLQAGQCLQADREGMRLRAYFALTPREHTDSPRDTVDRVRSLIEQAISDVVSLRPASMLSGGLDSTALTALLARANAEPVRTYSVDYEENAQYFQSGSNSYQPEQDAPYVALAVSVLGTRHKRVLLSIDSLVDALEDAMAARGFPGMADIDSSLYLFAASIAKNHRYVLSGECADEVFGGYPWFHRAALIESDCFPWSGSLPLRCGILREEVARRLRLEDYVRDTYAREVAMAPRLSGECAQDERLRVLQTLCFRYFMTNLQERAACLCAHFDLQVLTPFCDERLVQYLFNVPWSLKNTGGTEKGLLRAALADVLPDKLLKRRKSPFPKTYHPRYALLVSQRMNALLEDAQAPLWQAVDPQAIRQLMSGSLSPQETPWFGQLMAGPQMLAYLLQVNQWMTRYGVSISGI